MTRPYPRPSPEALYTVAVSSRALYIGAGHDRLRENSSRRSDGVISAILAIHSAEK